MRDPDTKVGVSLALNEESCYPLMVFILRFNLKSPGPILGKLFGLVRDPLVISYKPLGGGLKVGLPRMANTW